MVYSYGVGLVGLGQGKWS